MNINPAGLNKIVTNCASEIAETTIKPKVMSLVADTVSFSAQALSKGFTKLSQEVSHRFPNKGYRVVSLPKGMEIVQDGFKVKEKIPTVAIVDIFSDFGNVKIGSRTKAHHGDIVTKYAVKGLEDKVGVLAFDATPPNSLACEHKSIRDALVDLAKAQQENKNITVLNLSLGESYTYEELNKIFNLNLSAKNIENQKNTLLEHLKTSKEDRHQYIYQGIQAIDNLVENGVEVYSASGNMGDAGVDLFSLSKAQHIVSASDYEKANKALSTTYTTGGSHIFTSYYDDKGNLLKVTDGTIDFTPEKVKSGRKILARFFPEKPFELKGTSYASPSKLNEDLTLRFN